MSDEPEIKPLHFTHVTALVVDEWPERTIVGQAILTTPHGYHATLDGDTLIFRIGNGEATYRLRRDLPGQGVGTVVAELVEGTDAASLKRRAKKYEIRGEGD